MANDQRKQLIVDTFLKAVARRSSAEQRIQNGMFLRQQMRQAIAQGLVPQHPRFEWVRKQARAILELLLTMSKDYDAAHPGATDKLSVADLLDICDLTRGHLTGIIQAGLLDPDAVELLPFDQVQGEVTVGAQQQEEPALEDLIRGEDDGEDPES